MNGASHLLDRNGTYYFQRRVPDFVVGVLSGLDAEQEASLSPELIGYFKGKKFIRQSLKTKDKKRAGRLCNEEDFKFDNYLSKLEQWAKSGAPVSDTVSTETLKGIAQVWLTRELQADDDRRLAGISKEALNREEVGLDWLESEFRDSLVTAGEKTRVPQVERIADELLQEFQIILNRQEKPYEILHRELVKGFLHLSTAIRQRNNGEPVETPVAASVVIPRAGSGVNSQSGSQMTLDDLRDYWKGQADRNLKTVYDVNTAIKEFKALHGDLTIDKITKAQMVAYKDNLLGIGVPEGKHKQRRTATIEKRLTMLGAIFQVAVDNDKLLFNPCRGVKVAEQTGVTEDDDREPFTIEDLRKIFTSPIYTEGKRYPQGRGVAQYWLPLLALYTGMRREEIGQLLRTDVQQDGGTGIWFILTKAGQGKRLKNKNTKRRIPVHPDLVKMGFVAYVQTITEGQIFPELRRVGLKGLTTSKWSDWFGGGKGYLRTTVGITDPAKVFHSFRHTFKDAVRVAGIDEEVHDALTGHSNAKVGRMYGAGMFPLEPLYEGMKKVTYKGLDLSHLMREVPQT